MVDCCRVRIAGPLALHADMLWRTLLERGYSPDSSRNLLGVIAQLSRWALRARIRFDRFRPADLDRFLAMRRRRGCTAFVGSRSLDAVLGPLESAGVIRWVKPKPRPLTARERLLRDYAAYLSAERRLVATTAHQYVMIARRFLDHCWGSRHTDLRGLGAGVVASFVLEETQRYSVGTAKLTVTAMRSFLRYLSWTGATSHDLTSAVPAVAGWRLTGLPKAVEPRQLSRLLRASRGGDRESRQGLAVLLLMTRLGLRAGEVAALTLDDVDWSRGELSIRGKGKRRDILPLPPDVGAALARYLADRSQADKERAVFLRRQAPRGAISVQGVQRVVAKCFARAELPYAGTHRLRHTAATAMLRHGGKLDEIAQTLRHMIKRPVVA
jgi:site-specific recombinase XerD